MRKEKYFVFVILVIFLVALVNINLVSAALNLKITGTINNYSSDVRLKISSSSTSSLDAYDMYAKASPSEYSLFSSSISGNSISIDSWNTNPRILNLTYQMNPAQTGTLTFSWDTASIDSSLYVATFRYFGDDSDYTTQIGSDVNMKTDSSYSTTISNKPDIYIQVNVSDYVAPVIPITPGTGSPGGGGGGTPIIKPTGPDVLIGNKFMDVDLAPGTTRSKAIEIYNQGNQTIKITINPGTLKDLGILSIDEGDLSFSLLAGEKKTIYARIFAPEEEKTYTGIITVNGIGKQEIQATINVRKDFLFDAELVIPWDYKIINQGTKLPVQVTLTPMTSNPRIDVTATYIIKNVKGEIFLTDTRSFLINGLWQQEITFPTQNLKPGDYIIELSLDYTTGVAVSKASFEVKVKKVVLRIFNYTIILLLGVICLVILLLIIIIRNKRIRRKMIEELSIRNRKQA